jgi:C_GCAxxG_C_C family probable redox protein
VIIMDKKEIAKEFFSEGFNCSQSVIAAFSEKYDLPKETALKIACGFGGGMRNGEVCGAASGAIMVIGLHCGHSSADDSERKTYCYEKTKEFTSAFKNKNKSIVCRDLLCCDISTPDGMKLALNKGLFKTTCVDMICDAVEILERMGF